jgi:hypothetical protein
MGAEVVDAASLVDELRTMWTRSSPPSAAARW